MIQRSKAIKRHTPLKAKRATPRRHRTPRCSRVRCDKRAEIQGWCVSHAEAEADRLFSLYVRARDQYCTGMAVFVTSCHGPLQAAHIVGRKKKSTRYLPANCHALCSSHHAMVDQHHELGAKYRWAVDVIGAAGWDQVMAQAVGTMPRRSAIEEALGWLNDPGSHT